MKLIPISQLDPKIWDNALLKRSDAHFLQSWSWGEFNQALGRKIWRLAVEDDGEIVNQLLIIRMPLPFGWSILYSPRGSFVNKKISASKQQASTKLILDKIRQLGQANKTILFRIDPSTFIGDSVASSIYRSHGLKASSKNIQPKHTYILNLTRSEEALLKNMKPKTRYNIRLAQRHDITTRLSTNPDDIQIFLNLIKETANRDNFTPHTASYYQTQFEILSQAGIQKLFIASKDKKPIAAILVNVFGNTATYLHGASSNQHRNLMAPYLLQFSAILDSKQRGLNTYDFWGYHPDPEHAWAGLSRFKKGFGGQPTEYIGTLELPLNPLFHKLYTWINYLR